MEKIISVILCGGSGSRLWPLSRTQTPKQFLRLVDENTLLQATVKRNIDGVGIEPGHIVTVTLCDLQDETARQLDEVSPALKDNMLCEPEALNTCAAVALATDFVQRKFGDDALIWIQPADHFIGDEALLKTAVEGACALARSDHLVVFGIEPSRPEPGYGYIRKGSAINGTPAFTVEDFYEKPTPDKAVEYVSSGAFLWNSGMYVFTAKTGTAKYATHEPDTMACIKQAVTESRDPRNPGAQHYRRIKSQPFDKAITEKTDKIAVMPTDPQWSDIGSWESLWEIKSKDLQGNATHGNVVCNDTKDSMILAEDRLVTCVGLNDIVVIETSDAVLVANKSDSNALKTLVNTLREMNRHEAVMSAGNHHSWGRSRPIASGSGIYLEELLINPGSTLGKKVEKQQTRWLIAAGMARFSIDTRDGKATKNDVVTTNRGSVYSIENISATEPLKIYKLVFASEKQGKQQGNIRLFGGLPAQGVTRNIA